MAFHAHPDDEALLDAGTLSLLAAAGHRVVLVLATRGERGEVGADALADPGDLGALRTSEAEASAAAIGVERLVFLDLLDSGLEPGGHDRSGAGVWPAGSLCAADVAEVAGRLAVVLAEEHADLLIADDRGGGYGHPDHRRVHEVAVLAAATTDVALVEATIDREFLAGGVALAESLGLSVPEGFVPPDVSTWYTPAAEITHAVAVGEVLDRKRASMAAHASQSTGAADSVRTLAVFLGLPDDVFALAFGTEWFVHRGAPTDPRSPDLLDLVRPDRS